MSGMRSSLMVFVCVFIIKSMQPSVNSLHVSVEYFDFFWKLSFVGLSLLVELMVSHFLLS
jgi:hypothetical protein